MLTIWQAPYLNLFRGNGLFQTLSKPKTIKQSRYQNPFPALTHRHSHIHMCVQARVLDHDGIMEEFLLYVPHKSSYFYKLFKNTERELIHFDYFHNQRP